jgi:hypothetical protein
MLLLNDVFVDLTAKVLEGGAVTASALTDVPFRWLAETGEYVNFEYYDREGQKLVKARIRPDATLELGEPRRRLFLECETGAHTLVSSDPTSTGATNAKIARYAHLLAGAVGQHDATTPYAALCPDAFPAVLVFLVHSERRRDAIRKMVADPAKAVRIAVRAYTFAEAVEVLAAVARGRAVPVLPKPVACVSAADLDLLERALSERRGTSETASRGGHWRQGQVGVPTPSRGRGDLVEDAIALVARLRSSAATERGPASPLLSQRVREHGKSSARSP